MENSKIKKIQFIKNFKGSITCKPFRKFNLVNAVYSYEFKCWIHYTEFGIHFIPEEYVKVYKH